MKTVVNPANQEEPPGNSFLRAIGELRRGVTVSEASAELQKVVKEVQRTGKAGEVSLRLKIVPSGDEESVRIVDEITSRCPRLERKATTFFTDEEGNLQRDNPRQTEMFAVVEGAEQQAPPVREDHAVNQ